MQREERFAERSCTNHLNQIQTSMSQILSSTRTQLSAAGGVPELISLGTIITGGEWCCTIPAWGWRCPSTWGFDGGEPPLLLTPEEELTRQIFGCLPLWSSLPTARVICHIWESLFNFLWLVCKS